MNLSRRLLSPRRVAGLLLLAGLGIWGASVSGSVSLAVDSTTPTFSDPRIYSDVGSSSDYYKQVQSLARGGVFDQTNCTGGNFCPDTPIKRWQFAVWLVRALGEDDFDGTETNRFTDVDSSDWWAPYVNKIDELGIYTGCLQSPAKYCPESSVNRGHMAIWLARGFELPNPGQYGFTDIGGSNAHNADRVVAAEITTACNQEPLEFCAGTGVTKAQMAVFIFRALDWWQLNTIAESSRVPDNIFLTDYNEFSWYIKTQVVDRYGGDDQPWLQAAWNVTNRSTFDYKYSSYYMTGVHYGGAYPQVDHPHTVASAMTTQPYKFNLGYHDTFAHELAHVYTLSNRVSETPAALAAAHLYFSELTQGDAKCESHELLADTAKHLQFFYIKSNSYWGACPHLPYVATSEAITVVREAFQGQMPGWFYDTFQGTGGDLDYDAVWEAIRGVRDRRSRRVVVYQLRNSFGGYCSSHQVNEFLNGEGNLDAGQPWVDGGCDDDDEPMDVPEQQGVVGREVNNSNNSSSGSSSPSTSSGATSCIYCAYY